LGSASGGKVEAKLRSLWKKVRQHRVAIIITAAVVAVVIVLIIIGYNFDWTGFNAYSITWLPAPNKGASLPVTSVEERLPMKTLWDWLQLLGVLAIPVVVVWFTYTLQKRNRRLEQIQRERDQKLADQRAQLEREAAEKRAQTEREIAQQRYEQDQKIATDNQQGTALQAYFDRMSELLLEYDLLKASPGSDVRTIARVRTTTVVRGLDPRRKGFVLRFVQDSGLIKIDDPIIELKFANFSDVNLRYTSLIGASVIGANFWKADLHHAELDGDFRFTTFDEADLHGITLSGDFSEASLVQANLEGARCDDVVFRQADLSQANLNGAKLVRADLRGVNLSGADLTGADLRGAKVTEEQLNMAKSCEGMTIS
jgi:uncharacterized protein YjbI with pentapeptide repeats